MSSKIKCKSKFLDERHERVEFKVWLKKVPDDPSEVFCCYCYKNFSIDGWGIGQVFFSLGKPET